MLRWCNVPIDKDFLRNAADKKWVSPGDASGCALPFVYSTSSPRHLHIQPSTKCSTAPHLTALLCKIFRYFFFLFFILSKFSLPLHSFPSARFAVIVFNIMLSSLIPESTRKYMFRLNITSIKLLASIELTSWINYLTSVVHKLRISDKREGPTFEAVEIITVAFHENSKLYPTET